MSFVEDLLYLSVVVKVLPLSPVFSTPKYDSQYELLKAVLPRLLPN